MAAHRAHFRDALEQVLRRVASNSWDNQQFAADAPSADVVFYRTYSRRTDDGLRENWAETIERTITDISKLGRFTDDQTQLVMDQALAQHTMPSGRWLWVGGTPWVWRSANYSGAYNCTSTDIDDLESFGLLMDLAMMGSGTGAVLEDDQVAKLPPVVLRTEIISTNMCNGPASPPPAAPARSPMAWSPCGWATAARAGLRRISS